MFNVTSTSGSNKETNTRINNIEHSKRVLNTMGSKDYTHIKSKFVLKLSIEMIAHPTIICMDNTILVLLSFCQHGNFLPTDTMLTPRDPNTSILPHEASPNATCGY